jgi:hypothetical protein
MKIPILLGRGVWIVVLPALQQYGFWGMAHEARTVVAMGLGASS